MELLPSFPDEEDVVNAIVEPEAPAYQKKPNPLPLPMNLVAGLGGSADKVTERSRVEVQTFAGTYEEARDIAKRCQQRIMAARAQTHAGVVVDDAYTESKPRFVYYGEDVFRFIATYRVELRR